MTVKELEAWWWKQRAWTEIIDLILHAWIVCIATMSIIGVGGLPVWLFLWWAVFK